MDIFDVAERGCIADLITYHENGHDVRIHNDSILNTACKHGHLHIVKWLHEHGADIRNRACMDTAVYFNQFKVLDYLIQNGAQLQREYFVIACKCKNMKFILYYISHIAKLELMQMAIEHDFAKLVKYLYRYHDIKPDLGVAIEHNSYYTIQYLEYMGIF